MQTETLGTHGVRASKPPVVKGPAVQDLERCDYPWGFALKGGQGHPGQLRVAASAPPPAPQGPEALAGQDL